MELSKFGRASPLKVIQDFTKLQSWNAGTNEYFGFGFFLDATRTVPYYKFFLFFSF